MIETIEANFLAAAQLVALGIEDPAIIIIAGGAIEVEVTFLRHLAFKHGTVLRRRDIWIRFATWIVLSLEFALGADVIRTAVAPSWDDIGKLGVIAAIRGSQLFPGSRHKGIRRTVGRISRQNR